MKPDFLPSGPITFLPDALRHFHMSRHLLLASGILLAVFALWLLFHPGKRKDKGFEVYPFKQLPDGKCDLEQ